MLKILIYFFDLLFLNRSLSIFKIFKILNYFLFFLYKAANLKRYFFDIFIKKKLYTKMSLRISITFKFSFFSRLRKSLNKTPKIIFYLFDLYIESK